MLLYGLQGLLTYLLSPPDPPSGTHSLGFRGVIWVVVKIMVPFWGSGVLGFRGLRLTRV